MLVYGLEATAARKVVSPSTLIGPFEFEHADNTTLYWREEFCGKSLSFASLKPETFDFTTEDIFKHV